MNDILELGLDEIKNFFSSGGVLSSLKPEYEFRESQLKMALNVYKCLVCEKKLIVEAGTGTGKSYAYLVPVSLFVKYTDETVVISTETKNLQYQLFDKDVKDVLSYLKLNIPYHIALGRNNYICKRRTLDRVGDHAGDNALDKTWDNSLKETDDISVIYSQAEYCLGKKCKFISECDYFKNREIYMNSKIIICNHHVLFSDCHARFNDGLDYFTPCVLPAFNYVVIDEAHKIDLSATSCVSDELNFYIQGLEFTNAGKLTIPSSVNSKLVNLYKKEIPEDFFTLYNKFLKCFDVLNLLLVKLLFDESKEGNVEGSDSSLLIDENYSFSKEITNCVDELIEITTDLNNFYIKLTKQIPISEKTDSGLKDISAFQTHLLITKNILNSFFFNRKKDVAYYLQKSNGIIIKISPIYVSDYLRDNFFSKLASVIMTSATISVSNSLTNSVSNSVTSSVSSSVTSSFTFFKRLVGLNKIKNENEVCALMDGEINSNSTENEVYCEMGSNLDYENTKNAENAVNDEVKEISYLSPFKLSTCMKILISEDTNRDISATPKELSEIIKASRGGALVLFTNKYVMLRVFKKVSQILSSLNIKCYCQGEQNYTREELLELFKEDIDSVLFGIDSFWEGIDVPGESLRQVIIYKLPFPFVKDPMYMARERITENFFINYSLPYAVIKFKQGVGRLIRNTKDRGVITILDNSILPKNKSYGRRFLNSIKGADSPELEICSVKNIPDKVKAVLFPNISTF